MIFVESRVAFFQIGKRPPSTVSTLSARRHLTTTMGNCRISEDVKKITLKLWNQGWETEDITVYLVQVSINGKQSLKSTAASFVPHHH